MATKKPTSELQSVESKNLGGISVAIWIFYIQSLVSAFLRPLWTLYVICVGFTGFFPQTTDMHTGLISRSLDVVWMCDI